MMTDFCTLPNIHIAFDDDVVTDHNIGRDFPAPRKNASMADDDVVSKREIRINQGGRRGMIPAASKTWPDLSQRFEPRG